MNLERAKGIYTVNNPWGYQLNVNHPEIKAYYKRFLAWKGIRFGQAPSDELRHEFETYMMKHFKRSEKSGRK